MIAVEDGCTGLYGCLSAGMTALLLKWHVRKLTIVVMFVFNHWITIVKVALLVIYVPTNLSLWMLTSETGERSVSNLATSKQ
jgi:hypothetical protein